MIKKIAFTGFAIVCASILILSAGQQAAFGQSSNAARSIPARRSPLVGSWMTHNTGSTDVLWTLQSFSHDGRTFSTGQGDTMPPVLSPQIGAWRYLGGGFYSATFASIVYDPSSGVPPGTFAGTAKVTEMIQPDPSGKTLSGHFKFQLLDTAGNEIYENEGSFVGQRITADPS